MRCKLPIHKLYKINKDSLIYEINPITYLCIHNTNTVKTIILTKSTYFELITKLINTNNNRLNNKPMRPYLKITTFEVCSILE